MTIQFKRVVFNDQKPKKIKQQLDIMVTYFKTTILELPKSKNV